MMIVHVNITFSRRKNEIVGKKRHKNLLLSLLNLKQLLKEEEFMEDIEGK